MEQQNTEKLSDKAFARLILTSVFGVLLCLVLLCSTTYAWFTANVQSNNNEIKSATHCDLSVSVYKDGVALENIASGVSLKVGDYTVTLTLPKDSASGYCIITTADNTYYSDYIPRHENEEAEERTFTLRVSTEQTVTFTIHWGIYTRESSVQNGVLSIP